MLDRLVEEVRGRPDLEVEVLVCVSEPHRLECERFVGDVLRRASPLPFDLRFLATTETDYYVLKNFGASRATGELVVFTDCDVIPEVGWLTQILAPFDAPEVSVVGGNSYVEPTSLYSRTFAAIWIFPLRSTSDVVVPISRLAANNVAFRREVALRYPFPAMPETSRGSCQLLERSLDRRGLVMVTAEGARVGHPAPLGVEQFVLRGFSRGRDRIMYATPGVDRGWRGTAGRLRGDTIRNGRRLARVRSEVGISLPQLPLAVASWARC
jgi:hypothetical protein